jgi:hypothetical protein
MGIDVFREFVSFLCKFFESLFRLLYLVRQIDNLHARTHEVFADLVAIHI